MTEKEEKFNNLSMVVFKPYLLSATHKYTQPLEK